MFAYCNNCPIKYFDALGHLPELAIDMYWLSFICDDGSDYVFTSGDPCGKRLSELLAESEAFETAIQNSIPTIPWDSEVLSGSAPFNPYSFDNSVDKELSLSVGGAPISYECTYKEFQTFTEYHVKYTISDDYDFEYWGENAHKNGVTKFINNYGGALPMKAGVLHKYQWSYSGYYNFRREERSTGQGGGGGGTRRLVRC